MLKHNVLRRTRDPFGFKEQGVLWFHRLEGAIDTGGNVNRVHRSIQKKFWAGDRSQCRLSVPVEREDNNEDEHEYDLGAPMCRIADKFLHADTLPCRRMEGRER
jgi:hypothetical protein